MLNLMVLQLLSSMVSLLGLDYKLNQDSLYTELAKARQQVMISAPSLRDEVLAEALRELLDRGVKVYILTNAEGIESLSSYAPHLEFIGAQIKSASVSEYFAIVDVENAYLLFGFESESKIKSERSELIDSYSEWFIEVWQGGKLYTSFITRYSSYRDSEKMLRQLEKDGF